jgi:hypothetical protein
MTANEMADVRFVNNKGKKNEREREKKGKKREKM